MGGDFDVVLRFKEVRVVVGCWLWSFSGDGLCLDCKRSAVDVEKRLVRVVRSFVFGVREGGRRSARTTKLPGVAV